MNDVQDRLRAEAASRLRAANPERAACHDLSTVEGLLAAGALAADEDASQPLAAVVVGRFDLVAWARGTCAFALGLSEPLAAAFRRSFTRTIFLAGNPKNLRARFDFEHVADDESIAWSRPGPAEGSAGLRRLLKLFAGSAPLEAPWGETFEVAKALPRRRPPVHRDLHIATAGRTVAEALVHVNHLLVEAAIDGLIAPGDLITLRRSPRLAGPFGAYAALRVAAERDHPGRLQAFAALADAPVFQKR